jgi:hypothetical protein
MSNDRPTPAQKEALEYIRKHGPTYRPTDYHRVQHGADVRRDVWERCHDRGWLHRSESWTGPSRLTDKGIAALGDS